MTIRKRIIIAALLQAFIIIIICFFAYISFKGVLTKLRSIEIIDDLNISLLEVRKAEKNYFLYNDLNALKEAISIGEGRYDILESSSSYILDSLAASGKINYNNLFIILRKYLNLSQTVVANKVVPPHFGAELRSLGHELTTVSESLLKQERENVNYIISNYIIILIVSLGVIFIIQLILWRYFFRFIIKEIVIMELMIKKVSEGRLHEVALNSISPQNEIEIAIKAISDMARELEKREEELLQAGRLASLGVLISGVAHELGNPLNNISLIAQGYLSLYDLLGDEEKKDYMGDVYTQAERIRRIVENLLDFSRQKKQELKESRVEDIIQHSIRLVDNQLKISKVKNHVTIAKKLPAIFVDPPQIEQVLVNLFINSIQAMPEGGDLFIEAYHEKQDNFIIMKITDTGKGIGKEILPYIFDPFFTTKSTKGTGLGLSVSYGIIRQHHGDISVESEQGKGTTFIIKLPSSNGKGEEDVRKNHSH
jgi:signal transduction histidine kinase